MHRSGDVGVAHAGEALHVEPRRTPRALTAETDPGYSEFRNDVVREAVFRSAMHRQSRERNAGDVYNCGTDQLGPANCTVLREIIVQRAKTRQVLRHETLFAAKR